MRLNGRTITGLRQALKECRQFTIGEQMICDEMLATMRREAQLIIDPVGLRADDPPELAAFKRKGLREIAMLAEEGHELFSGIEGMDPEFIRGVLLECSRGYVAHPSHNRGIPASIAAAKKERAEMEAKPLQQENAGRLDAVEVNYKTTFKALQKHVDDTDAAMSVLTEQLKALTGRIATLESGASLPPAPALAPFVPPPPADEANPPADPATESRVIP